MIAANIEKIKQQLPDHVKLIAVSKTKPVELIKEAYDAGQRAFGENKVQEMVAKQAELPADIEWHLIGHLQSNKVKYIAPFVHLIHSVDSYKLLETINKEGLKNNRVINCLLQVHIAEEETKFGLNRDELFELIENAKASNLQNIAICGLMGMATNTDNEKQIETEFNWLKSLFDELKDKYIQNDVFSTTLELTNKSPNQHPDSYHDKSTFSTLSMGMSSDYQLAVKCGSTMIRVGSSVFGNR